MKLEAPNGCGGTSVIIDGGDGYVKSPHETDNPAAIKTLRSVGWTEVTTSSSVKKTPPAADTDS